ncbi:hypothetical protein [Psychrobacillus sp. FSL K6-4046]|uniref:hypothetical protein n=1 Tax=Psychrobacillus sp. FSL K6-4046 TaxID=2921550 RepID=UPI00260F62E1|nr:hypothetical protein [uncultured Psychrobacillus sp.]
MEVKSWEVKEQFCFPQSFGVPKEVKTINVTPQYFHEEMDNMVHINGIYHITCHVEFEEGEVEHHATSEFTEIEDLDLNGELGYFEYAVPMSVEISKDRIQAETLPTVSIETINCKAESDGIEIVWLVNCEYETHRPKTEEVVAEVRQEMIEEVEETLVLESSSHREAFVSNEQQSPRTVQEPVQEQTNVTIKNREVESPAEDDSELQFIFNLEDGYTKLSFPSNNVLK